MEIIIVPSENICIKEAVNIPAHKGRGFKPDWNQFPLSAFQGGLRRPRYS